LGLARDDELHDVGSHPPIGVRGGSAKTADTEGGHFLPFQLLANRTDYGSQTTATDSDWSLTNWVEGAQYVVFRSVAADDPSVPVVIIVPGRTCLIPVELLALGNENALGFSLSFDPGTLTFKAAALASSLTHGTLQIKERGHTEHGQLDMIFPQLPK
jgi:hypothetical protein